MEESRLKKTLVILLFAFVGWALCGAIMGVGPRFMSMETTLIVHLVGAPIIFGALALLYFTKFAYTSPLWTAVIFTLFVILVDFFVVAMLFMKSFEMFASPIGTWIPFALIFLSTYLVGWLVRGKRG